MTHKKKWLLYAPAGLVLVGAGASMLPWAGGLKDKKRPAAEWIGAGTLALAVLNAGLSIFGRGVVEKVLYELHEKPQPPAGNHFEPFRTSAQTVAAGHRGE